MTPAVLLLPILLAVVPHGQAQPAAELLERGLYLEEAHGDLDAAIEVYKKVAIAPDTDRPLAAQALLRVGACHLKSGRIQDARTVFADLANRYPEQRSIIARMRAMRKQSTPVPVPAIREDRNVRTVRIRKFLTLVLRHDPEAAGVTLDREGWTSIDALLSGAALRGFRIGRDEFEEAVRTDDNQRFGISDDGARVRATFGHSVQVDLGLRPVPPPRALYYGTMPQFLQAIMVAGLQRGERQYVLLAVDIKTAACVSMPEGQSRSVILRVAAAQMQSAGFQFFLSEGGVWLTEGVPPQYLSIVPPDEVPSVCGRPGSGGA